MNLMRSRIRMISLILTCLLLASLLWGGKSLLVPTGETPASPEPTVSVPAEEASPAPDETSSPPAEPSATPEALYDTFGL